MWVFNLYPCYSLVSGRSPVRIRQAAPVYSSLAAMQGFSLRDFMAHGEIEMKHLFMQLPKQAMFFCLCIFSFVGQAKADALANAVQAYEAKEYVKAEKLFRPLAKRGNAKAEAHLGLMYANGQGLPRNYEEAVKWFRMAAEQGNAQAQFQLAGMYEEGKGVQQNYVVALMWVNVAMSNVQNGGAIFRDRLASKMTPEQIVEAQDIARQCMVNRFKGCRKR